MAYTGSSVSIPLGQLGLQTDDPMNQLPPNAAITANNISLFTSRLEKSGGSAVYKAMSALTAGIVGLFDWYPTPTNQRLIAATSDGKIWRDTGDGTFGSATPIKTGLGTLDSNSHFVAGGAEAANRNRKLFALTNGSNQIQVLSGDGSSMAAIANPAADWASGNYPTFSVMFQGRHFTFGSSAGRHTLYWSGAALAQNPSSITTTSGSKVLTGFTSTNGIQIGSTVTGTGIAASSTVSSKTSTTVTLNNNATASGTVSDITFTPAYLGQDHENFEVPALNSGASSAGFQTIYSGEGDGLIGGIVYKGSLLLFKRPFGMYVFNFTDTLNYTFSRYSDSFGIAAPHAACIVVDDLIGGNNEGSLTSLKATNAYGSFETGDVLNNNRVRDYIRQNTDSTGLPGMHSIYYAEKQVAYFSTRDSVGATSQNRLIVLDVSRQTSRISLETKDQPTCLALRKDQNNVLRPIYGATDGKVYLMDQSEHSVNGTPYTGEFQTPFIDFSYLDASLADKVKLFDFLTISFVTVGAWSFFVDVYVDGKFSQTLTYAMTGNGALDSFVLDVSRLASNIPQQIRKRMACAGKTISFRIYNSTAGQYFRIDKLIPSFRLSAEQNRSSRG